MADLEKNSRDYSQNDYNQSAYIGADIPNDPSQYREEAAADMTASAASPGNIQKEASGNAPASTAGDAQGSYQSRNSMEGIPATTNAKSSAQTSSTKEETATEIAAPVTVAKSSSQTNNTKEETAAEIAAPVPVTFHKNQNENAAAGDQTGMGATAGVGLAYVALALSILSLFVMPILFGIAGIVLGFIARARGATGVGAWAIGIGVVSLIIGIFVLPFF